ncbi:hypothetical protein [Blastococcus brunescens]|uniref:Uncharacterized protein n=1 Tax=Blastococcus brunescens TaxID=1564165 RepID=A0ABZ1AV25_9ACTN|nr:hypothetical protein [Blastococcus sp. BMG 8361]WRL62427.1 hypothetical protein U6N30_20715 [Blastococcus sp. BMG 8361]
MSRTGDPAERHHLPMVCTCGPERAAAGEALYQRVKAGLARGSTELRAREVTDRTFVDDLILSLLVDHNAAVERIPGDQWFLVVVRSGIPGPETQVACPADQPSLGLAAIWEWYEQRKTQP